MTKQETDQIKHLKGEIEDLREVVDEIQDLLRSVALLAKAVKWTIGLAVGIVALVKFSK